MARTVWLIDDCMLSIRLTKARLSQLDVGVHTFPSGSAAIAAWMAGDSEPPHVVLMDLNMPGTSGLEAGQTLRDAGYVGLMLLHTSSPPDDQQTLADGGFDGILRKPASKDDLAEVFRMAAEKHPGRAA